jgi:hypothetical protein
MRTGNTLVLVALATFTSGTALAFTCLEQSQVVARDLREDGSTATLRALCTPGCYPLDSVEVDVNFRTGDFSSAEESHIMQAIETAWEGGSNEINRGAELEFIRVSNVSDMDHNDRTITIVREPPSFWTSEVPFAHAGRWITAHPACNAIGGDIVFNDSIVGYHPVLLHPSKITLTDDTSSSAAYSLGQIAIHEMGHVLGFGHHDNGSGTNSVMATGNPAGGDGAGQWRIHENDFVGLTTLYPGGSTGSNLHLSKYVPELTTHADPIETAAEGWAHINDNQFDPLESSDSEGRWMRLGPQGLCPGETFEIDSPLRIHLTGTQSLSGVDVVWFLVDESTTCSLGTRHQVGSQVWSLSVNGASVANPTLTAPSTLPNGLYFLCAEVDPNDEVAESSEGADNLIRSDQTLLVPDPSCP